MGAGYAAADDRPGINHQIEEQIMGILKEHEAGVSVADRSDRASG
jgi:hypothetical protein